MNSVAQIKHLVGNRLAVPVAEIDGKSRRSHIVYARQVAIWIADALTHHRRTELARQFNVDHSYPVYAVQNVEHLRSVYPSVALETNELKDTLARLGTARENVNQLLLPL
jgi:chromosomal replication initiation ATPase DnaA